MATTYSDDLRRKLMEAYERNEGSLSDLADRFCVSLGWAKKVSAQKTRTGKIERTPGKPRGPASKLTAEIRQQLREWIAAQSDLTLAELQLRLYQARHVEVSLSRLWTVLRELDLRLKKSRSTPPSKTPQRAGSSVRIGVNSAKALRRKI